MKSSSGLAARIAANSAALAPAQCVLRDAVADGVGDAGARDWLPARDVCGMGLWRGPQDRRLRRCAYQIPDLPVLSSSPAGPPRSPSSRFMRGTRRGAKNRQAQQAFDTTVTIMTMVRWLGTDPGGDVHAADRAAGFSEISPRAVGTVRLPHAILLPGQIFFYAGGIISAVLLSRRMFLYPALSPVFYGSFIILGGLIGAHRFGIAALAYGALTGSFVGPFLINASAPPRRGCVMSGASTLEESASFASGCGCRFR